MNNENRSRTAKAVWVLPAIAGVLTFMGVVMSSGRPTWFAAGLGAAISIAVVGGLLFIIDRQREANQRTLTATRKAGDEIRSLHGRLSIVDSVTAETSRRDWEPSSVPWVHIAGQDRRVLLLPGAAYHLPELVELDNALGARGISSRWATGYQHWERLASGLVWEDIEIYQLPTDEELRTDVSAVVAMKDWAGYGEVVASAKRFGIPTFAKVEGAQDFLDVDTGYTRNAYQQADYVLCQGLNDYEALDRPGSVIVGSTRLERLWNSPSLPAEKKLAVVNLNFSYGVMTDSRDLWLSSVVAATQQAGFETLVAVHPAERYQNTGLSYTKIPISRVLPRAAVLISRFSTVPFEAMARGVAFVYHNPHKEKVPTFAESDGAFQSSTSVDELRDALSHTTLDREANREAAEKFFRRQVDIDAETKSGERGAAFVDSICRRI